MAVYGKKYPFCAEEGTGLTLLEAERAFQLLPDPPKVVNINDYIVLAAHGDKLPKKLTVPFWYEWEVPQAVRARKLSCNAPRTDSDRGMIIRWVD